MHLPQLNEGWECHYYTKQDLELAGKIGYKKMCEGKGHGYMETGVGRNFGGFLYPTSFY